MYIWKIAYTLDRLSGLETVLHLKIPCNNSAPNSPLPPTNIEFMSHELQTNNLGQRSRQGIQRTKNSLFSYSPQDKNLFLHF